MKQPSLVILLLVFVGLTRIQSQPTSVKLLMQLEENMKGYAYDIMNEKEPVDRFRADSFFVRSLVKALQVPYAFSYPFDSLKSRTISILYAPDSSFRIFTWQVMKDYTYYHQSGAIQMRTTDGSLKLIPLFDHSDGLTNPTDSVRDNRHWIGAVYYNIIQKKHNNKNYYTLLGYDENDARSTKKWIEVLSFDDAGRPQFGGRYFNYNPDETKPPQPAFRFCLEFKKQAGAKMNYNADMDMIILAKLTSETGDSGVKYTLIPFGTFEGFRWVSGCWVHVPLIREMDARPNINPQQGERPEKNPEIPAGRKRGN